ncbi:hypothetical protein Tco_0355350 [Tanacetum coccineum]
MRGSGGRGDDDEEDEVAAGEVVMEMWCGSDWRRLVATRYPGSRVKLKSCPECRFTSNCFRVRVVKTGFSVIMEYLLNISKRRAFWSINDDILKITVMTTNTPYPSRKIRRIRSCTHQRPQRKQDQYAISRRPIRRIRDIEVKYFGRYQAWSLLQETLICHTYTLTVLSHVMSTTAYVDSETITQADKDQNSRVPVPLPYDPYVAVRQAQLVDTDIESDPEEAPSEAGESQPLGSRLPLMGEEFKASKPSGTRTIPSHSPTSSDSTASLSLDHPLTQVSPTPTPTRVSFHPALSPSSFCKRYRSSYETSSSSSLTLPTRKRYRGTSELILDTETKDESSDSDVEGEGSEDEGPSLDDESYGLEDEGLDSEEGEAAPEGEGSMPSTFEVGQSSRSVPKQEGVERKSTFRQPTLFTWVDPEDGRVYTDILTYVPPVAPVQTPPYPEWSSGSLPVSPSSLVVPSPIASLVTTPEAIISADEDQF